MIGIITVTHGKLAQEFVNVLEYTMGPQQKCVEASSILALLTLGAGLGAKLTFECSGDQAEYTLSRIQDLITNRFEEDDECKHFFSAL